MTTMGQQSNVDIEPVVTTRKQKATLESAMGEALKTGIESAQELRALREELAFQKALREKEREQMKLAEEEQRRIKEMLRKSHANNDRLKEEKDKLRRQAETEIKRMKEEL